MRYKIRKHLHEKHGEASKKSPFIVCLGGRHFGGEPKGILDIGLLSHLCLTITDFWHVTQNTFHFCLEWKETTPNTYTNPKTKTDLE